MTPYTASQRTLVVADVDRRRMLLAMHPLRRAARRLLADCEHLMDNVHDGRKQWVDAAGDALIGSRHLVALLSHTELGAESPAAIALRIREPQQRIIDALSRLLELVPVGPEDELLLQDARSIRDAAADLQSARPGAAEQKPVPQSGTHERIATSSGPSSVGRPRVLLADDDNSVRNILQRRLALLGYDTIEVTNGKAALEAARKEHLDLLLTDITMPEMSGVELLKELKADEATRDLPVIVLSGQGDSPSVVQCLDLGADDHIAKPYDGSVLKARVRACIERKRLRDAERMYINRVGQLTDAAEAVERQTYVSASLADLRGQNDALGRLARVFDRTVTTLRSREERLQHRLDHLRGEMTAAGVRPDARHVLHDSPFDSGEILASRYEISETVGKGGMGMVYRARDLELQEEVAIKVVRSDIVKQDPTIVERLKSEIRLTRKLSHRNIVRAHDIGEFKGTYFISMEYVKGVTVAHLLDRRGRLGVEAVLAIGTQLAEALAAAHEAQIIHRDVKPDNLIVDSDGVLKVMDFGIARHARVEGEQRITQGGFVVGTPQYMAPEQLVGGAIDARTDLFSTGVVLYECLAGRPPFLTESPQSLLKQLSGHEIIPLSQLVAGVPERLDALILQLLEFQPGNRPSSARDLVTTLAEMEHAIQGVPHPVPISLEFIEPA